MKFRASQPLLLFSFFYLLQMAATASQANALFEDTVHLTLRLTVEIVPVGKVKCGKVAFQCQMNVTYQDDCGMVDLKVEPICTPKKKKCSKGVSVSFETSKGCAVTGKFKSNGKKQSMTGLKIEGESVVPPLATTTTTTIAPLEETVRMDQLACGQVKYKCNMFVVYNDDCSAVAKVTPSCNPKKRKCKGISFSFVTKNGCTVTGKYKNTGKKQSVIGLSIELGEPSQPTAIISNTTTTTLQPVSLLTETFNIGQLNCSRQVTYKQCKMVVTFKEDCSRVSKVVPSCTPKKSKCKGVLVFIDTPQTCTVTGTYKNTGKKQSLTGIAISGPSSTSTTTTTTTSTTTTTTTTTTAACLSGARDVSFFDASFTFSKKQIEVGCCAKDNTLTNVTCGQGASCQGQCSAIEASLCPSGKCTGNPDDCGLLRLLDKAGTSPSTGVN